MQPRYCRVFRSSAIAAAFVSMVLAHSPLAARAFGDDALTSARSVVSDKVAAFAAVGMVECRATGGEVRRSNGFLVGSRTVIIANGSALGGLASLSSSDACKAVFYTADGTVRDSIGVDRIAAPDHAASSDDLVLFRLRRVSPYAKAPLNFRHDGDPATLDGRPITMVTMVAWRSGWRKVRSGGVAYRLSPEVARQRGAPDRIVMASDYDSVSASRGSPVLNASGQVVGVHSGSYCPMNGSAFDKDRCFNEFVLLGDAERRVIAAASIR